jgi:hypothetical protein
MSVSGISDVSSRILPREMAYSLDKYGRIKPCFNNYCFGNFDFVGRISASLNDGDFQIGDDKFVSYYSDDEDDKRTLLEYASSEHGITCDCCNSARDRLTGFIFRANKDSKIVRYFDDNDVVAYRVEDGDYVVDEAVDEFLVRDVHKGETVEIGTSCVGNITGVNGYNLDRLYKKQAFANRVSDITETEAISVLSQQYKAVDVKLYVACVIATMKSELGELPNGLGDYSRHETVNCDRILHRLVNTNRTPGNLAKGLDSSITKTAYNMYKNMYVKPNANYFKIAKYAGFDPKSDEIQQLTDEVFDTIKDDDLFKNNSVISHNMEVAFTHAAAPRSACEAITRLVSHVGLERGDLDFSLSESPKHRDFRLKFNDEKITAVEDMIYTDCPGAPGASGSAVIDINSGQIIGILCQVVKPQIGQNKNAMSSAVRPEIYYKSLNTWIEGLRNSK